MTITDFIKCLEAERDSCLAQAEALANDDRRDEANMIKIRANIYDIFAVISRTAEKRFPRNQTDFIRERLETIPAAWNASLAVAEKQNAPDRVMTERIKLQAMTEIRQKFNDVMGEGQ